MTNEPRPPVVDVMKKTVVFLFTECVSTSLDGVRSTSTYAGTAFLLSVADPRVTNGGAFTYLVTNKHVVQPGIENGRSCDVDAYAMRVDTRTPANNGSYSVVGNIPLSSLRWTYSPDPSVDLAITPIGLDVSKLDVVFLPSDMLLGDADVAKNHIVEGDSVLFTGLFVQFVGQVHSEPIVREGKIAMMPREQVPTTLHSLGDVYLVDSHVFGGNSGSPMFVNLAGQRDGGLMVGINYKLLGVVSGFETESSTFEMQAVASYAGTVAANSGIAMVVPAQKVLDIINSPDLKKLRDDAVASMLKPH